MKLNIDLGGFKGRTENTEWTVMDINAGEPNSNTFTMESGIYYDFSDTKYFPLPPDTVNAFYSSMTIEHMNYMGADFILSQMFRTLIPGKKIRIVVPDFDIALRTYFEIGTIPDHYPSGGDSKHPITRLFAFVYTPDVYREAQQRVEEDGNYWDNHIITGTAICKNGLDGRPSVRLHKSGHKAAWNFDLMKCALEKAGFVKIEKMPYNECSKIFEGLDRECHKDYGLYVEAQKPA